MWHRFSVVLAFVAVSSMSGLGYRALSPQTAATPSPLRVESTEIQPDTVAVTYVQRDKRPGSGRRGMRG